MITGEGHLAIVITTRVGPATALVINKLRPAQNNKIPTKKANGAAWVAQRFSAACSPGRDPGDLGSSPTSGSLHGACFSLCLSMSLLLCVSHE